MLITVLTNCLLGNIAQEAWGRLRPTQTTMLHCKFAFRFSALFYLNTFFKLVIKCCTEEFFLVLSQGWCDRTHGALCEDRGGAEGRLHPPL